MTHAPEDAERLVQEALTQLGWEADPKRIAARVWRLNLGLPREDEFSVVCTWLGRCDLVHKLDQKQVPVASRETYQVPDLFAVFRHKGRRVAVLVEVKASNDNTLSFRPDYLRRLQNYAGLLRLPALIAWKFHGLWILFDISHLQKAQKNFNISFGSAIRENLLGLLAGDFSYSLSLGSGVHLRFRKDELISEVDKDGVIEQQWKMTCDDVSFTDGAGEARRDLDPQTQALFLSWPLEQEEAHSPTHVTMSYVARSDQELFAHMALVRLLDWQLPADDKLNWRTLLGQSPVLHGVADFTEAIKAALRQKIVHHVIHQVPATTPAFLGAS